MQLIEAYNVKKYYGDRLILSFDSLQVYDGDKIGIVGLNGVGKSTLLHILSGEIMPDEGKIRRLVEISYLMQFEDPCENKGEMDAKILSEMKVSDKLSRTALSGGERTRVKLARALSARTPLLFADEPTANLDMQGVLLLQKKLQATKSLLLISHDRSLLDSVCNKIMEIKDGKIRIFIGNYSDYESQKTLELESENAEYERYAAQREHLTRAVKQVSSKASSVKKAPKRMGNSEARLHKRQATESEEKLHKTSKAIETRLEKLETKEKPKEIETIKLDFSLTNPPKNKVLITAANFNFSYDGNLIFEKANFSVKNGRKIAVLGANGAGKTTLLNAIYRGVSGVRAVPLAKFGYFRQNFENLDAELSVLENVMKDSVQSETTARTILARLLIKREDVNKKIKVLSGGERIKAAFAKLFVSSANILLLDEPTNYLDMPSVEALQLILKEYTGTILFVSHDKHFVETIATQLLFIRDKKCESFDGGLLEYEQKQLAKKNKLSKTQSISAAEKMVLELRLAQVLSKLSSGESGNKVLEDEYLEIMRKIRK